MKSLVLVWDDRISLGGCLNIFQVVLNEQGAEFAVGKVIAIEQYVLRLSDIIYVRWGDLDVDGKAFEVLQSFDVVRVKLDNLNGRF